ncbi:MAG: glycosyltransferase [Actinomycetota bacterium]|nr:glycosyltransferase [Actinomycetota bacterium]
MAEATLELQLECEFPDQLQVGKGTALFICGWCFCAEARIASLDFLIDGESQPAMAHSMPRLDPFRALHPKLDPFALPGGPDSDSAADPLLHSYRSGFWGIVRIGPRPGGADVEVALSAALEGGGEVRVGLARIAVEDSPARLTGRWPAGTEGGKVAICMATHNPPVDLLERQINSIIEQNHRNWVCVISDDCSSEAGLHAIQRAVAGDERFIVSRSPRRLGFYRNFERALALAPGDAEFVAMADQDDHWRREKLEVLLRAIGDAQLVYSDARVVLRDGKLVSETWWTRRRNNHSDLLSLLVANSVTGAASLMRADLLEDALPFPPAQFAHFHDHWVALVALARGAIAYVDEPLYDYVQHGGASLGHAAANQMPSMRERIRHQRAVRERVRMWRLHYFVDLCRLMQLAAVLEMRCGPAMSPGKRRTLERFLAGDESLSLLARLGLRGARELLGHTETLGAEWMLFHALAWRRLLAASARGLPQGRFRLDALPPPTLHQQPGRAGLDESVRVVADKVAPLRWTLADDAPIRVNLLIPTIDLRHFFGGYIAKLNLARRLLARGMRVRIVTVDPVGPLPPGWRQTIESYSGLHGLFEDVEVAFGREASELEMSAADSFIATTWWTAHIARAALELVDAERFLYLIQEYEPFTFPMGSYAALAAESYQFAHFALFSSETLRDYFRAHQIGVYATDPRTGDGASASFQNAITAVDPPNMTELASRSQRRLLFYARPEAHAARNMFELGALALSRALAEGAFSGWELHGIGTVASGGRISLGGGRSLELLPRSDQSAYARTLREHDVGMALMYTPHPSLVPIEMASAGMLTVTNTFEQKTPEALAAISANLITAAPRVEALGAALCEASAGSGDYGRRLAGASVAWSTAWEQSFDDQLLDRVIGALAGNAVARA